MRCLLMGVMFAWGLGSVVVAQEVKLTKPFLMGSRTVKEKEYDRVKKERVEVDRIQYELWVGLKNVSDKPLVVATAGFSKQVAPESTKQVVKLDYAKIWLEHGKEQVIPPREDLRLVELRPGEVAVINLEVTTKVPQEEISVRYRMEDLYGGRFGYWTGDLTSEPLVIKK